MTIKRFPKFAGLWRKLFGQKAPTVKKRELKKATEKKAEGEPPKYCVVRIAGEIVSVIDVTES